MKRVSNTGRQKDFSEARLKLLRKEKGPVSFNIMGLMGGMAF